MLADVRVDVLRNFGKMLKVCDAFPRIPRATEEDLRYMLSLLKQRTQLFLLDILALGALIV